MTRNAVVAATLAVVAGLLWWMALPSPSQQGPELSAESDLTPEQVEAPKPEPTPKGTANPPSAESSAAPKFDPEQPAQPPSPAPAPAQNPAAEPSKPVQAEPDPAYAAMPPPELSGPVEALSQRFATEPRDSSAPEVEAKVQAAFRHDGVPDGLFKSVLCRETVCKFELLWSPERSNGYMVAMTLLSAEMDHDLGIKPSTEPPKGENGLTLEIYWQRKPRAK